MDRIPHPHDAEIRRRAQDRRAAMAVAFAVIAVIAVMLWSPSNWLLFGEKQPRSQEVYESKGPSHCGWQDITFLTYEDGRYVNDSEGEIGDTTVEYADGVALPASAEFTGWRDGERELWASPEEEDRDAVFIVVGDSVERWPRTSVVCF